MRLWSIHPKYLDRIGLVALWREGLLAQKVLLGKTRGYKAHPQLTRFRACSDPISAIGYYLKEVLKEAEARGYRFDAGKIVKPGPCRKIKLKKGQLGYEWKHLMRKLQARDTEQYRKLSLLVRPQPHPLFTVASGGIEDWERMRPGSRPGA